jgi:hypothetical protein
MNHHAMGGREVFPGIICYISTGSEVTAAGLKTWDNIKLIGRVKGLRRYPPAVDGYVVVVEDCRFAEPPEKTREDMRRANEAANKKLAVESEAIRQEAIRQQKELEDRVKKNSPVRGKKPSRFCLTWEITVW